MPPQPPLSGDDKESEAPTVTTPVQDQQFNIDDVFNNAGSGGGGAPSYAWPLDPSDPKGKTPLVGHAIQGEITDIFGTVVKDADTKVPKLNKNGVQMPQFNLTIRTSLRNWQGCTNIPLNDPKDATSGPKPPSEDTGERRIYVKFRMLDALAKAIGTSEQKTGGPRVGAKVAIKLSGLENVGRQNPLPDYEARYVPPVVVPTDDAWANATAAQQQAPPPAAAPPAPATPADDPWANAAPAGSGGWSDEAPF